LPLLLSEPDHYFGYPQAHEHDAERAVRTGLALAERVPKLAASETLPRASARRWAARRRDRPAAAALATGAASATFALNAALCLFRVRFMSCSCAHRRFLGQGSTLAFCLISGSSSKFRLVPVKRANLF